MRYRRILFVCTGNICRSPMAEGMLKSVLPTNVGYEIGSAGLRGLDGQPAHRLAVEVTRENDVDLGSHRARTVSPDLLQKSDLILVMENSQKAWIESRMPAVASRVHMMDRDRGQDIPDPMGGTRDDFRKTLITIKDCIDEWLPNL